MLEDTNSLDGAHLTSNFFVIEENIDVVWSRAFGCKIHLVEAVRFHVDVTRYLHAIVEDLDLHFTWPCPSGISCNENMFDAKLCLISVRTW